LNKSKQDLDRGEAEALVALWDTSTAITDENDPSRFGAVPGCFALYFRLTIPETPRYTFDVERDVQKAVEDVNTYRQGKWGEGDVDELARARAKQSAKVDLDVPKASWSDFVAHYREWRHVKVLLGCALSWFFLVGPAFLCCQGVDHLSWRCPQPGTNAEIKRRILPFTALGSTTPSS
jgi:hypothetical protein